MKELIPVFSGKIANKDELLVDARLLHTKLESKQDFSTWIKKRISKYGFMQDVDFIVPLKNGVLKSTTYGNEKIDYHLSMDMAKELGMIENNVNGRLIRRYFIEMERRAKSGDWKGARDDAALGYLWMSTSLKESRDEAGKETKSFHYANEARMLNAILTGEFAGLNRNDLNKDQLKAIGDMQRYNSNLIAKGIEYKARKDMLASRYRERIPSCLKPQLPIMQGATA
jgi:phage anti-repressor protein